MQIDYNKFEMALKKLGKEQKEEKITKEEILKLHFEAVTRWGGENGVRDENLLDSVCVNPYNGMFGTDLYPTVFDKAAKLLLDFSRYQVFIDGNKRTGVLSMQYLLLINGYDINMDNEGIYELTMAIANNRITEIEDIVDIIKPCCKLIDTEEIECYTPKNISEDKDKDFDM